MFLAYDCWGLRIHRNICSLPSSLAGEPGCLWKTACLKAKPHSLSLEKRDVPWFEQSAFLVHSREGWEWCVSVTNNRLGFLNSDLMFLGDPKGASWTQLFKSMYRFDSYMKIFMFFPHIWEEIEEAKENLTNIFVLYWFAILWCFPSVLQYRKFLLPSFLMLQKRGVVRLVALLVEVENSFPSSGAEIAKKKHWHIGWYTVYVDFEIHVMSSSFLVCEEPLA